MCDILTRLKKSDRGIFHSKASLQKLSAKFSAQLSDCTQQMAEARNEYLFALTAANAHLDLYYQSHLPDIMKVLDGDLYERLRDYLSLINKTELSTCRSTQERFRDSLEASLQVSRQQNLQLFLKDSSVFSPNPIQQFQPAGADKIQKLVTLIKASDEMNVLDKEARRWTSRSARDYKLKTHGERVLQRLEDRRKNASEEEVISIIQKMEEVKESVRKAEVSKVKADARVELLRQVGVDVDTWLSGAMTQADEELEQERRLSEARMSNGEMSPTMEDFDFSEFEDMDDGGEIFEESPLSLSGNRSYPTPCHVLYNYKASQADELTITQGERLEVMEDGDVEEWVKARNKNGQVGYVPEKYITYINQRVAESLSAGHIVGLSGAQCFSGILELERSDATVSLARALYDYEGQSEEELTFPEGAIIQIVRREEGGIDDGFWKGEFNGRVGVFPSLVVEELTGDDPNSSQELPSPAPPPFSPPMLSPPSNQRLSANDADPRQNGSGSAHSSPDFAATRLRPMRAAPPPPTKGTESTSSDP
ncbi:hypothetical protein GDO78_006407 [Eleutherodactylus coqui]|uniref:FCH and double SH3 domains 1 n=1 Tax=Eleutherodactylus coqui TaxID=57060 RepID=A0A8J6FMR1_ELECQ|nr:hypothetical protein GDO78_006407 [Eleutherodactylus coqui]